MGCCGDTNVKEYRPNVDKVEAKEIEIKKQDKEKIQKEK